MHASLHTNMEHGAPGAGTRRTAGHVTARLGWGGASAHPRGTRCELLLRRHCCLVTKQHGCPSRGGSEGVGKQAPSVGLGYADGASVSGAKSLGGYEEVVCNQVSKTRVYLYKTTDK